jgi:hypothetical protein
MIGLPRALRRRLAAALAVAALAVVGPACKKDEEASQGVPPAAAGEPAVTVTKETAATPAQPAGAPSKVVLLEAGGEPRTQLRYLLPASAKEKMGMTITMAIDMDLPGQPVSMHLAPMHMEMELAVVEKLGDREARCKFSITSADIQPGGDKMFDAMRDQLSSELKKMVGAAGNMIMDDRGVVRDMSLTLPDDIDPQVRQTMESSRQAMEQISSPLPEEPVGIGGRWQVDQVIAQNGLTIKQSAVFELVEFKGKKGALRTTVVQSADPQVAQMPLPPGFQAQLLSHSGAGTGTGELDLGQLVPRKSSVNIKTETAIKVTGHGQDQTMKMKNDSTIELSRL